MMLLLVALSSSIAIPRPVVEMKKDVKGPSACDICTWLVQYVETLMVSTSVEEEIIKWCELACSKLGDYEKICDQLVSGYVPLIMKYLEQGLEELDVCTKIGFCSAAAKGARIPVMPRKLQDSIACTICQQLVNYVEQLLVEGFLEEEVMQLADQMCQELPAPLSTMCSTLVQQYIGDIIDYIEEEIESLDICIRLGLCEASSPRFNKKAVQRKLPARMAIRISKKDASVSCDMCQSMVKYIEQLLVDKKTEEEIIALVQVACQQLPSPISSICVSTVSQFVPVIMSWLEQEIEVLDICVKLGLCDATKATKKITFANVRMPKPSNSMCDSCQKVVGIVEAALNSTLVESEVVALVEAACAFLPVPVSTVCNVIASTYVPKIMQWLEQGLEAIDICTKIGFCSAQMARRPHTRRNDFACTMCQTAVNYVAELMISGSVEEEIEMLVNELCATLPAPISTICEASVAQCVPLIMKWLEEGLISLDICVKLGLCEGVVKARKPHNIVKVRDGVLCQMCQGIVSYIEELLVSTTVEEEIEVLCNELCDTFAAPISTACRSVVAQFVPAIIQWIEEGVESLDICVNLGLCDATSMKVRVRNHARVAATVRKMMVLRKK